MSTQNFRSVERLVQGIQTSDGAGVRLTRVLTQNLQKRLDPFLMLDAFRNDNPDDYIGGFPDHPHRGFETVTYMLAGRMRHRDNAGNEGLLEPQGAQWMTAGSGLIHSELPEQEAGLMEGFQLWVNLPAKDKNTPARYQHLAKENIPVVTLPNEAGYIRVIAGEYEDARGAAQTFTEMNVWDIVLHANAAASLQLPEHHNLSMVVLRGDVTFNGTQTAHAGELVGFVTEAGTIELQAGSEEVKILLLSGVPIDEPVVGYGPFVMNTQQEIRQAINDFNAGRFGAIE